MEKKWNKKEKTFSSNLPPADDYSWGKYLKHKFSKKKKKQGHQSLESNQTNSCSLPPSTPKDVYVPNNIQASKITPEVQGNPVKVLQ